MSSSKKQILLVILDGWGIDQTWGGNAIGLANTPFYDSLLENYPHTQLEAFGEAVGLPFGEPGNSEVGHLNLGSGQPVSQGLTDINNKIESSEFFNNPVLKEIISYTQANNRPLHLIGLVSDGGIHAHISHLFALLKIAKELNQKDVYIHFITDGRDSSPTSSLKFLCDLEEKMAELEVGKIATVMGRFYAMDRDNNWDRVEKAYDAIFVGSEKTAKTPKEAISKSYESNITDEFIVPISIENTPRIKDGDGVIFFNYRSDRSRESTRAFVKDDFSEFTRKKIAKNLRVATFGSYQEGLPVKIVFEENKIAPTLSGILTKNNLKHLHVAETEKYAHVTYFFNGGEEAPFEGEGRIMVLSPKVKTYDLEPEMSAHKITQKASSNIEKFDFTVLNYANADMVGHTGNLEATILAVEYLDKCLKILVENAKKRNFTILITADHGNAEQMINPLSGLPDTEHTSNPVPFILIDKEIKKLREGGRITDISPTILDLLNIEKPKEMIGKTLIQ